MAEANATVIWYRERFARGVVRLDTGRQYQFVADQIDALEDVQPRLRVCASETDGQLTITGPSDGSREFAPEEPKTPPRAEKRKRSRKSSHPALPDGHAVRHKTWGSGFVLAATAKMVRVQFTDTEEVKNVRLSSLEYS
jgi:hypothetical protein